MTTTTGRPDRTAMLRTIARPVLLNLLAPVLAYHVATGLGASELAALSLAAVFPLADVTVDVVRERRVGAVGALTLGALTAGLLVGLLTADPYVLLVRDSITTAVVGLAFLASLGTSRPMVHRLAGEFADPRRVAARWAESAAFRAMLRRMTLVWGVALLVEAALRVLLSLVLAPGVLVTVSPLLMVAVVAPTVLWTRAYVRRARTIAG